MTGPTYRDGIPTNLEAAALDALEWLRVMKKCFKHPKYQDEDKSRLAGAIRSLDRLLPDKKPIFQETRAYPEAVALIVYPTRPYERPDTISDLMAMAGIE